MATPRPRKWVLVGDGGYVYECANDHPNRIGVVIEVDADKRLAAVMVSRAGDDWYIGAYCLPGFSGDPVPDEWSDRYGC